ncbi:lysozyme inhibitor LprI family protein [Rhodanobacter sp. Col0626]|uniref:lysozyme inhibitor LprI family protein n=1 Tax=Rhodanobacter sp. Col0626 TaxID=3415679 RepID=UPI003CF317A3
MKSRNPVILTLAFFMCCGPLSVYAAMSGPAGQPASFDGAAASDDGSGSAGVEGLSQAYLSCQKSAGEKLLASDACMTSELKYQDARLNKTYKALLGVLKPESKKALVEAERSWLQSQSKDENFESTLYGDTQVENAQQLENKLFRLCARANALDKYLALAQL